jgi:hypothetical protein
MKAIKTLAVVATLAVAGIAHATTPAEKAGLCAGNAMIIKKAAEAAGPQYAKVAQLATAEVARDYNAYGSQPGFTQAAQWTIQQNTPMDTRIKVADGCEAQGF